jgi:phosphatidylserine decarboxylase
MKEKRSLVCLFTVVVLCYFLNLNVLAQGTQPAYKKHEPITKQLIIMVEHNPELKKMLIKSIEMAKRINPDRTTNPAQTLEEYYAFVDWAAKAMPWSVLPDLQYPKLYEPLSELEGKGYYNNSLQYHEPYRTWLINFTKEWGMYLSTEKSWNEKYYKKALADDRFGLQKGWYENPSKWKTFNDFFARYLKSPDQRPIASPNEPSVISSPADSSPEGVWKIDKDSNIVPNDGISIKSNVFNPNYS